MTGSVHSPKWLLVLLTLVGWLGSSPAAQARKYYIRIDGNDNNTGLTNTPGGAWRHVNTALYGYCNYGAGPGGSGIPMLPGDTLLVNDGVYEEDGYTYGLKIQGVAGSNTNRFVMKSINKHGAKLSITSQFNCFNLINCQGVTIDGFDIYTPAGSTNTHSGINIDGTSEFVTISNCKIHNFGLGGVGGSGHNIIIENNEVYDNSVRSSGNGSGISFYHPIRVSISTLAGGYGHIIRGNYCHDNYCELFYTNVGGSYGPPTDGNGIIIDDFDFTQNINGTPYLVPTLIENNLCVRNGGSGIQVYDSKNVTVRNNTCYYNRWALAQYATTSTTYPSADINAACETGHGSGIVFVNNLSISDPALSINNHGIGVGDQVTSVTVTNNYTNKLFFPNGPLPTPNVIGNAPQFVGASTVPGAGNFHLASGSPALNIGLTTNAPATDFDGVARPQGGGIDAGCYEQPATQPAPALAGFSPTSGVAGTSVTLTGTNFTNVTAVTFNGVATTTFTVNSPTSLTVSQPAGATTGKLAVTTAGGTATSAGNFTVLVPTVTTFTSTAGGIVGAAVTITGTNFTGATAVAINGVAVSSFTVVSATSISTTVPAEATTGKISVTTPTGTGTSVAVYKVLPKIFSFGPATGAPGATVTITGTGLLQTSAIKFSTVLATSFTVVNSTTLTVVVPPTALTGKLYVTTPGGTALSTAVFTVAPTISGFTPGAGSAGSVVLIFGLNFTTTTTVAFNGVNAAKVYNSTTQLTATVPATATTGSLTVTSVGGSGASTGSYTVTSGAAPTLTSIAPTLNVAAGTVVTLTGTNLSGATAVRFNTITTPDLTVVSATQVQVAVPAGATTGLVYVLTPTGMAKSAANLIIIQAPTVASLAPASGSPGALTLLGGVNYVLVTSVKFNGVEAAGFTVNSTAQIAAIVPAGATTGKVSVTAVGGIGVSVANFTVTSAPAPTITGFTPATGPRNSTVVLTGTNFTGVTSVKLGTVAVATANYVVNSPTQLTLKVPATGTTNRFFVTAAGGLVQSATLYTVILPPTITSFSPATAAAGTLVTINGTNLTDASAVTFGGVAATSYTVVSAAKITATVPAGALTGAIQVTTVAGTASRSTFTATGGRPGPLAAEAAAAEPARCVVFPNPATSGQRLTVQVPLLLAGAGAADVYLLDALGRRVATAPLDGATGQAVFGLTGVAGGVYSVRCGTTAARVLIQQ